MAQRTVHYAFGQILAERCDLDDAPRFLLGSLLPDAIFSKADRDASHYAFRGDDGTRYYEFDRFRSTFADQMCDPLYLGYYMHLVEDSFYRSFCHRDYHFYFIREKDVRALHRDYHLLNPWLVEHYALVNRLTLPADFAEEPLARIARFDLAGLLADLAKDFAEQPEGCFSFLSREMMDEFITRYLPPVEEELRAVLNGKQMLHAADFAWKKSDE